MESVSDLKAPSKRRLVALKHKCDLKATTRGVATEVKLDLFNNVPYFCTKLYADLSVCDRIRTRQI